MATARKEPAWRLLEAGTIAGVTRTGRRIRSLCAGVGLLLLLALLTTGGSAQGHVTQQRASKYIFGFSGIRPGEDLTPKLTAALTKDIGGQYTRTVIHWQSVEPKPGVFTNLDGVQTLYSGLVAAGIKPIFVLQYAPAWARDPGRPRQCGDSDDCHYPPARSMLGEWRKFITYMATRFPAAALEIWNEPNYRGQWEPAVDPARYAELLAQADNAAAAVNPAIPVYAGGLGTAIKAHSLTPPQFLQKAYAANPSLKGHADTIGLHVFPPENQGPHSDFQRFFTQARAAIDGAHDDAEILVSELGRTTSGPMRLTEKQQADVLSRAVEEINAMPGIAGVLLYTLADRNELPYTDHEYGYGLVRPGPDNPSATFTPKPAFCAFAAAAGHSVDGCPKAPPPAPPPPGRTPRLMTTAKPRKHKAKPGGHARRFKIKVTAPKATSKVHGVRVCLESRKRSLKVKSKRCKRMGGIEVGGRARTRLKVGFRKRARRRIRLRFVATATDARQDGDRAVLKPRN